MTRVLIAIAVALAGCDHGAATPPSPSPSAPATAELERRVDELSRRLDQIIDALAQVKTDDDRAALRARLEQLRAETRSLLSGPDCENPLTPGCM